MEEVVRWLILLSYLLWQTAIVTLVLCHWLAVRTLWRMTGRKIRAGLIGGWTCLGLLIAVGGRMSWQLRTEMEVLTLPSPWSAIELFSWSAATLTLATLLGLNLRILFEHIQRHFDQDHLSPG